MSKNNRDKKPQNVPLTNLQSHNPQQPFKIKSNLFESCHQSMGVRKRKEDVTSDEGTSKIQHSAAPYRGKISDSAGISLLQYRGYYICFIIFLNVSTRGQITCTLLPCETSGCDGYSFIELHNREVIK